MIRLEDSRHLRLACPEPESVYALPGLHSVPSSPAEEEGLPGGPTRASTGSRRASLQPGPCRTITGTDSIYDRGKDGAGQNPSELQKYQVDCLHSCQIVFL